MITKEQIEELKAAHAGKPSRRSFIELAHHLVPALIARVEELEKTHIAEYRDDKTRDRYMELLAYACESFDVDVQRVELSPDPVTFICTAKSQVDEVKLAEAVGRVMSEALNITRDDYIQQAKAAAWDEGYRTACDDDGEFTRTPNPYRKDGG